MVWWTSLERMLYFIQYGGSQGKKQTKKQIKNKPKQKNKPKKKTQKTKQTQNKKPKAKNKPPKKCGGWIDLFIFHNWIVTVKWVVSSCLLI